MAKATFTPTQPGTADTLAAPKGYEFLNQRHALYQQHYTRWSRRWRLIFGDVESKEGKRAFLPKGTDENDGFYDDRIAMSEIIPEMPPVVRRITNKVFSQEVVRNWNDENLDILERNMDGRQTKASAFMRSLARKVTVMGVYHVLADKPVRPEGPEPKTLQDERDAGLHLPFFVAYSPLEVVNWSTDRNNNLLWALIRIVRHDMDADMNAVTFVEYTKWTRQDWTRWTFRVSAKESGRLEPVTGDTTFGKPQLHNVGRVPLTQVYFEFVEPMIGQGLSEEAFRADLLKIRAESHHTWDSYVHAHPQILTWTVRDLGDIGIGTNTAVKLDPTTDEDMRYLAPESSAFEQNKWTIEDKTEAVVRHQGVDPLGIVSKQRGVRSESGIKAAWTFKTSEEQILQNFASSLQSGEEMMFEDASRLLEGTPQPFGARVFEERRKGSIGYPKKFDLTAPKERMEQFVQAKKHLRSKTLLNAMAQAMALAFTEDLPTAEVDKIQEEIKAINYTAEGQFEPGGAVPGLEDEGEE